MDGEGQTGAKRVAIRTKSLLLVAMTTSIIVYIAICEGKFLFLPIFSAIHITLRELMAPG